MATTTYERPRVVIRIESIVLGVLALTFLVSPFVSIEPSPYEGCVLLLLFALMMAGITVDRLLMPLIVLVAIWSAAGAFALMPVAYDMQAVTYLAITIYMAVSSIIFACALARNVEQRLSTILNWYVVAAVTASTLGIIGYFGLVPGSEVFLLNGRATALFKDPNVYGPFLIFPLLHLIQVFIYRGFRPIPMIATLIVMLGLFLSFSRGAWGHFVASILTMLALMFWTNRDRAFRVRLVGLSALAGLGVGLLLALLLSFSAVGNMFKERANFLNYYDAGEQGRFGNQAAGLLRILDYPNGLGPKQFMAVFGADPHNVYLASLYAYGWVGGIAYAGVVLATLIIGFYGLQIRSPWQATLIAAYGAFVGEMLEGFIIDTDHWRHYFLLVGMVWGLSIASMRLTGEGPRWLIGPATSRAT